MYGQWASLGMGNQQMGWTPPGGAAPTWKMGGQKMGWSPPGGGYGSKAGGLGVYSPELMAMLRQRLAGMQGGIPSGVGGYRAQPMPAMPANPGAFTQYQRQPMPVAQPTPQPAPITAQPMPVRSPAPAVASPYAPLPGIGRRLWANRE